MASSEMIIRHKFPNVSLGQSSTGYSTAFPFKFCSGFGWVKLTTTGGSVWASYQCSSLVDGPWYDPVDKDNAPVGVIISSGTTMSVGTRVYSGNVVLSPWIRIKFIETGVGSTTISPILYYQEKI